MRRHDIEGFKSNVATGHPTAAELRSIVVKINKEVKIMEKTLATGLSKATDSTAAAQKSVLQTKEKYKIIVMAILLAGACYFTYLFHLIFTTGVVFTHFFYIPIILASLWWKRKGVIVALFLAAVLIFSHFFIRAEAVAVNDLIRAPVFIIVALIAAILSERIAKTQKAIKKEKRFSANVIASVPDSLVVVDTDLRIIKANLSFQKVFGMESEKVVGTHITDILGDEDRKLSNALSKLFGTKTTIENIELRFPSEKLGERIFNIAARGIIQAEKDGEEEEVLVVIEDITERKRAEEALQQFSEELELKVEERTKDLSAERNYTRHLIESSPDFQMTLDKDGKIMDVNEAFECVAGKSREKLIGSSIYNCLPKEETEKAIAEIFEKGKVRDIELTADIPGKGTLICNFSGTVFTTPEGNIGIFATGRDITEQRRAEKALQESEEKFRTFMETASDLMDIADKDGNFTYVNESMARTLGYSKEEMIGMHITEVLSKEVLEKDFKPRWEELIAKGEISLETTYVTKDRKEIYGEIKAVAIYDSDGKYAGSRAVFHDITERKRAEEELQKLNDGLEQRVKDRTAELEIKNEELEHMNRVFVGRELRMAELKKQIAKLEKDAKPDKK
jgi:PAS domain S-box-containing protein